MIYGGILAGGKGTRMGRTEMPKQFLNLGNRPMIIHTIEQFLISNKIDKVIVATNENWRSYTEDIINKYYPENDKIVIINGGTTRNETIANICDFAEKNSPGEENIVVTHDAVRPFITQRIINDNIEAILEEGIDAVDTVIPASDTIVEAKDGEMITNIPIRDYMYQGQTPQTFRANEFIENYNSLTEDEKSILSDAIKIYVLKNKNAKIVRGETFNMKVTSTFDLKLANAIVNMQGEDKND